MAAKSKKKGLLEAQNPLILQCNRLMEAFAKSNDERDFYLDRQEGFILYADLDKSQEALEGLYKEVADNSERYCPIPKLSFFETKKLMEGFVHEKVYDIDTKEKLLDIIGSKQARDNFLEFIYDHHAELEKWQQYYQERSRIRIIEWLRDNEFIFVFEEDLDLTKNVVEKLKQHLFDSKVPREVTTARKVLEQKSKVYYSSEALNPRPKRGRPPKQQAKVDVEPQITVDIYTTVPKVVQTFLFSPDISSAAQVTFSDKFDTEEELRASLRGSGQSESDARLESLNQKLAALRRLSSGALKPTTDEDDSSGPAPKPWEDDLLDDIDDEPTIDEFLDDERKLLARSRKEQDKAEEEQEEETPPKPKRTTAKKTTAKKTTRKTTTRKTRAKKDD